jgi:hypothetical protein
MYNHTSGYYANIIYLHIRKTMYYNTYYYHETEQIQSVHISPVSAVVRQDLQWYVCSSNTMKKS